MTEVLYICSNYCYKLPWVFIFFSRRQEINFKRRIAEEGLFPKAKAVIFVSYLAATGWHANEIVHILYFGGKPHK